MTKLRGADALAACLERMQVQRVYGVIGTSIVGFLDGLYELRDRIRYVSCRHEQVAASMADAEGRLTRRPGVVALHSGPGALNAMIGLANAAKDCSPVLAIAGSIKRKLVGCDGMLELDHVRVFRPICRDALRVESVQAIPKIMSSAWKAAMAGPGGPVMVEVPEDIWSDRAEVDLDSLDLSADPPATVPHDEIAALAQRLMSAARPVILAGAGVGYSHSGELLRRVAEHGQIPVATTGNGRGAISELHPLSLGRAGYGGGNPVADEALKQADFILGIGCTLSDMTTYEYTWPITGEIVVVNLDHDNELKRIPLSPIYADAGWFLRELLDLMVAVPECNRSPWFDHLEPQRAAWRTLCSASLDPERSPISPAYVCHQLRQRLSADAIVAVGAGMHLLYPMAFLPCQQPQTFLSAVNFGAMGFGFPAALAAKLVHPQRQVIALLGDGDFMMTVQDLETAVREKIPIRIFVINDNAYRVLAFRQRVQLGGRIYGSTHANPDFLELADSFGIKAWRIQAAQEVDAALDGALNEPGPTLVEVVTDPNDIPPTNLEAAMHMT